MINSSSFNIFEYQGKRHIYCWLMFVLISHPPYHSSCSGPISLALSHFTLAISVMRQLCLTRRCCLCQFEFSAGDDLIALDGGKRSKPLKYGSRPEAHDDSGNIAYKACAYPCIHAREQAIGCHVSCLRLVNLATLQRCLEINRFSFEPQPDQERARHRWLRDEVTSRLATTLPLPLPAELRREISQYLLQEYAVVSTRPLPNRRKAFSISAANLGRAIQHHIAIEGQRYLSNLTIGVDRSATPAIIKFVYICEDHRGIQKIVCSTSTNAPNVAYTPGLSWKTLPIRHAGGIVEFHGDGMKLRHLVYRDGSSMKNSRNVTAFPVPRDPKKPFRLYPFHQALYPSPPRIRRFPYNFPGMTGLSVCCNPEPIAMHTHTTDKDLSIYKSTPETSVWLHIPFKPSERITSVWMRQALNRPNQHSALAFTTNTNRTQLLGVQTTPALTAYPWLPLDAPAGRPSSLFLDSHPAAILALGFDSKLPAHNGRNTITFPKPVSEHPSPRSSEGFFWSQASLKDVAEITPCRGADATKPKITGLLFHYADRTMACVGQVRFDCLDEPLAVKSSERLYLRFEKTEDRPYVAEVLQSTEAPESTTGKWFHVPWTGILEWWHSYRQCQVWHEGSCSMKVKG
ncbi:hypothetical protein BHE90_016727 [Fusarium euwallaceae]|uniref:Uncharacterized protein n=1 Tax=Fusarium euwallaceae TaxID=1147111 RepID=A0A430KZJ1_9HYPO|nr:hypothetical protein BHE90_016727 [Fusarium euwallaceae]